MGLPLANGSRTVVEQVGKKLAQSLGTEQPLGHRFNDDRLELLVSNAGALAGSLAAAQVSRASVIAIAPALARRDGKGVATLGMTALGDPSEHGRAGHERRRGYMTGVARDPGLDLEPFSFRNNDGSRDFLPLVLGSLDAVANVVDTVEVLSAVGRADQDIADVRHMELASAVGRAAGVEMQNDFLEAHGTVADADPLHSIDLLHQQCFGRIDHQPLLGFGPTHFGGFGHVADGREPSVPVSRFGVAAHGIARELRGLARLILVEVGEHRADQIALGVVTDLLRDGDQSHAGTLQLAAVMLEQVMIAKQARKAVHADFGDAAGGPQRMFEQRLQTGPIVVGA